LISKLKVSNQTKSSESNLPDTYVIFLSTKHTAKRRRENSLSFDVSIVLCRHQNQWDRKDGGQIMVSESLVSIMDKSAKPELDGNIRTVVRGGASARQGVESQMSAGTIAAMLREVSRPAMEEIGQLISELQTLRRKLQTDGERIERDIRQHAELSEQATKLTKIISDGVKQLPERPES
jgi:hypothetical protein